MHPVHRPIAVRPCLRLEIFRQVGRSPCRQLRWLRDMWSFLSWRSPDVVLEETHLFISAYDLAARVWTTALYLFLKAKNTRTYDSRNIAKGINRRTPNPRSNS